MTERSVLVHPLTHEQRKDHESRNGWLGRPWPSRYPNGSASAHADIAVYLDVLPLDGPTPLQYAQLGTYGRPRVNALISQTWDTLPSTKSLRLRKGRGVDGTSKISYETILRPPNTRKHDVACS